MSGQSGWFKDSSWEDGLELCESWFQATSIFLEEGTKPPDVEFHRTTIRLIDFCYDVAQIDPMPLWEVYLSLSEFTNVDDAAELKQLRFLCRRAEMIFHRLQRKGLVFPKSALREPNGPSAYGPYFVWESWRVPLSPASHALAQQIWDRQETPLCDIVAAASSTEALSTEDAAAAELNRLNAELQTNGIPLRWVVDQQVVKLG